MASAIVIGGSVDMLPINLAAVIFSCARASGRENGTTEGVTEYFKFYRLPYLQRSG